MNTFTPDLSIARLIVRSKKMDRDAGNNARNPNQFGTTQGQAGAGSADAGPLDHDPLGEPSSIEEMQQKHRLQMLGMTSMPNLLQNPLQHSQNRGMELMGWAAASSGGIPQAPTAAPSSNAMNQASASMFSNSIMQQLQAGQQQRLDVATQMASLQPQHQQLQLLQQPASSAPSLQEQLQQLQQLQRAQLLQQQQQQQLMNISNSTTGSADANAETGLGALFDSSQSSDTLLLQLQLQQLRQQHQNLMAQQQHDQMQNPTQVLSATSRMNSASIGALQMQNNAASSSSAFLTPPPASVSAASSQALFGANSASPAGFLGKIPGQDFSNPMQSVQQQQQQIGSDPSGSFSSRNSVGFFDAWTSSAMPLGGQILPGGAPVPSKDNAPTNILKPLSAYNYFFTEERERLLDGEKSFANETNEARKMRLLSMHWSKDRNKRRPHRKTHGKISFTTLSKHIGQKWRELSESEKSFYKNVAKADMARYKEELAKRDREIANEASLKSDRDDG
jgi:hypothetical protein